MENKNNLASCSVPAVQRIPKYYRVLRELQQEGCEYISSTTIGNKLNLNPILVKKDLSLITTVEGKPRLGYNISILISDIETFLGYDTTKDAAIIGVGNLGRALISYPGFKNYGINIAVGFDIDANTVGTTVNNVTVLPMSKLEDVINRLHIHIAILTVPKAVAKEIAKRLENTEIEAIWNWAPTRLEVNDNIAVKNEDIASSLAVLTNKMKEMKKD